MNVTTEDLLDALREALAKPSQGDASTMPELQAAMGYGAGKVRELLKRVQAEGRLEVIRMHRPNLIGTTSVVPGYRIKAK